MQDESVLRPSGVSEFAAALFKMLEERIGGVWIIDNEGNRWVIENGKWVKSYGQDSSPQKSALDGS
jgi:hypothetical protein